MKARGQPWLSPGTGDGMDRAIDIIDEAIGKVEQERKYQLLWPMLVDISISESNFKYKATQILCKFAEM